MRTESMSMARCSTARDHWVGSVGSRLYTDRQIYRKEGRQTDRQTDSVESREDVDGRL